MRQSWYSGCHLEGRAFYLKSLTELEKKPGREMIEWKSRLNTIKHLYISLMKNTLRVYQRINYKKENDVYLLWTSAITDYHRFSGRISVHRCNIYGTKETGYLFLKHNGGTSMKYQLEPYLFKKGENGKKKVFTIPKEFWNPVRQISLDLKVLKQCSGACDLGCLEQAVSKNMDINNSAYEDSRKWAW